MSDEWRPKYREAYPKIDVPEIRAAAKRGHSVCDFAEPWGEVRGHARCEIVHHRCQVWYDLDVRHTISAKDYIDFDLIPTSNGIDNCRMMFRCPECGSAKQSLFFKDQWACQSCLGLLFRSQVVPPLAIKFEKLKALNSCLENGRPHGMHNNTYLKMLQKRNDLEKYLYGIRPIVASEKFSYHLTNKWRPLRITENTPSPKAPIHSLHELGRPVERPRTPVPQNRDPDEPPRGGMCPGGILKDDSDAW